MGWVDVNQNDMISKPGDGYIKFMLSFPEELPSRELIPDKITLHYDQTEDFQAEQYDIDILPDLRAAVTITTKPTQTDTTMPTILVDDATLETGVTVYKDEKRVTLKARIPIENIDQGKLEVKVEILGPDGETHSRSF